jgi:saccharopine dehydrogenase (NAD+, L-lysine-forming)
LRLVYNRGAVRILVVGTGGVGSAFASIARHRSFFESCALADYEPARPESLLPTLDDGRFSALRVDASSKVDIVRLIRETRSSTSRSSTRASTAASPTWTWR